MALYHFHLGHIGRSKGHTAIAAAAYRAGEKLFDDYYGEVQDYTRKGGVVKSLILALDHVPDRLLDRQTLWNEVEQNERRKDAQLAYSFDIALQNELSEEENIELIKTFVKEELVARGMICDIAIHNPDKGGNGIENIHAHILSPIRPFLENGAWGRKQHMEYVLDENGEKIRKPNGKYQTISVPETDWGKPEMLDHWREKWADMVNAKFAEKGLTCRIDHRSYKDRELDLIPQVHEGSAVRRMEARGIATEKGTFNRWVRQTNEAIRRVLLAIRELSEWMKNAREELRRIENPSVTDMVVRYYSHRDEVANTYERGRQKAKQTNFKQMTEACAYLSQNNISTPAELDELIEKKRAEAEKADAALTPKKEQLNIYEKRLAALDTYEKYLPTFEQSQKIFFKGKKAEYQQAHRKELNQFNKARRTLTEQIPEGSFDTARELWTEKAETLKKEIAIDKDTAGVGTLNTEIDILKHIRAAIDYCITPAGTASQDGRSTEQARVSTAQKQAAKTVQKKQPQAEQKAEDKPERGRVSLKGRLIEKQAAADAYNAQRQKTVQHRREETNLS